MFRSARIKLTTWYLLIIMIISISFSIAMYKTLTLELDRVQRLQRVRVERRILDPSRLAAPRSLDLDQDLIEETKDRLVTILVAINLGILGISSIAGYFLAGRTLKPIKEMVDEQYRFISDASHELRTPLTALRTSLEVSLRDKNLSPKQAKEVMRDNLEEVEDLQALSEGLLILTKSQNPAKSLSNEVLSLKEAVSESIKKVSPLAEKKGVKIESKITDTSFEADREKIVRVLVNLLDNAIKYSPSKSKVSVKAYPTDHKVKIEIKDRGVGVAEKDLPHLFDRFYRVDKSRSQTSGYGLGLSIAQSIVQLHQGEIRVKSKVGEGSEFIITLPKGSDVKLP